MFKNTNHLYPRFLREIIKTMVNETDSRKSLSSYEVYNNFVGSQITPWVSQNTYDKPALRLKLPGYL